MVRRAILIILFAVLIALVMEYYDAKRDVIIDTPPDTADIVDTLRPSVLTIWGYDGDTPLNQGSGFIISKEGLVITSRHVIEGAGRIVVAYDSAPDSDRLEATVIASDGDYDIALLKIDGDNFAPVGISADGFRQGDDVLALGYPGKRGFENNQMTVTSGIISRILPGPADGRTAVIQTDAYITYGSSGGPLYDTRLGAVIGVCTWSQHDENDEPVQAVNYAIAMNRVMEIFSDYIGPAE